MKPEGQIPVRHNFNAGYLNRACLSQNLEGNSSELTIDSNPTVKCLELMLDSKTNDIGTNQSSSIQGSSWVSTLSAFQGSIIGPDLSNTSYDSLLRFEKGRLPDSILSA